jgi:hypothetical protein
MAKTALDITGDQWLAYDMGASASCFAQVQTELPAFADLLERQASR